jgi:DNA-binding transcriptional regulator YhcF (GntR family)
MIQVNVNTAAKAYEQLADDEIIYQRRGMGYYVTAGARDRIMAQRREKFRNNTLQKLFEDMHLLGFTIDDIVKEYDKKRNNPSE